MCFRLTFSSRHWLNFSSSCCMRSKSLLQAGTAQVGRCWQRLHSPAWAFMDTTKRSLLAFFSMQPFCQAKSNQTRKTWLSGNLKQFPTSLPMHIHASGLASECKSASCHRTSRPFEQLTLYMIAYDLKTSFIVLAFRGIQIVRIGEG